MNRFYRFQKNQWKNIDLLVLPKELKKKIAENITKRKHFQNS